jgi:ElaB/YqjD/DUF883 family membrane-anchored ribosome-binding protein
MDKKHENWTTNIKSLDLFFIEKKPTKAPLFAALPAKIAKFHNLAAQIESMSADLVALENSGTTQQKSNARDALINLLHVIVPNLRSVANGGTDEKLKTLTEISDSEIARKRDTKLRDFANDIYKSAVANATALADYGADDSVVAQLRTLIDSFDTLIGESGDAPKEITTLRNSLYGLFPTTEAALKDIDDAMRGYMTADPDFYNEYILLRPVRALGIRHKHPPQPTKAPQAAPAK